MKFRDLVRHRHALGRLFELLRDAAEGVASLAEYRQRVIEMAQSGALDPALARLGGFRDDVEAYRRTGKVPR